MILKDLCKTLDLSTLTIETMVLLTAAIIENGFELSSSNIEEKYGELEATLFNPKNKSSCMLSVVNNRIDIIPLSDFSDDNSNSKIILNADKSKYDWSKIASLFLEDALNLNDAEYRFEIYNEDGDLLHDRFKTTSLVHALMKVLNLDQIRGIDPDEVYEVIISVENTLNDDAQIKYKKSQNFFALCDRNLADSDVILALSLLHADYPETTYSIRANKNYGI